MYVCLSLCHECVLSFVISLCIYFGGSFCLSSVLYFCMLSPVRSFFLYVCIQFVMASLCFRTNSQFACNLFRQVVMSLFVYAISSRLLYVWVTVRSLFRYVGSSVFRQFVRLFFAIITCFICFVMPLFIHFVTSFFSIVSCPLELFIDVFLSVLYCLWMSLFMSFVRQLFRVLCVYGFVRYFVIQFVCVNFRYVYLSLVHSFMHSFIHSLVLPVCLQVVSSLVCSFARSLCRYVFRSLVRQLVFDVCSFGRYFWRFSLFHGGLIQLVICIWLVRYFFSFICRYVARYGVISCFLYFGMQGFLSFASDVALPTFLSGVCRYVVRYLGSSLCL